MRFIKVINIEGIERNYTTLYSFKEMTSKPSYDMSQLEIDREIEERDCPVGWVLKRKNDNGKLVFIPVFEWEKFEIVGGQNE